MQNWIGKSTLAFVVVGLLWANLPALAPGTPLVTGFDPESSIHVSTSTLASGFQQLVVLDTRTRSLAIYHIDPAQGKVHLRSVRNLTWDLAMEQYNGQSPLPSELRQIKP